MAIVCVGFVVAIFGIVKCSCDLRLRTPYSVLRTSYVAFLSWSLVLALSGAAAADDRVRLVSGGMQSGHVVDMDPTSVTLDRGSGAGSRKIPVNEIEFIHFEAEPLDLRNAKSQVLHGEWEKAAALLNRIKNEPTRPETLQDLQFYKALCAPNWRWPAGGTCPRPAA